MPKVITATTFVLFWVFYEMSGGSDFTPRERIVVSNAPFDKPAAPVPTAPQPVESTLIVNASFSATEAEAAPAPAPAQPVALTKIPAPEPVKPAEPEIKLVYVAGNWVNMRRGPGTNHPVVDTLPRGTEAELIATNDIGWARIRLTETDQLGWMAESLLSGG